MSELIPKSDAQRLPDEGELVQIGQWYWVHTEESNKKDFFGCVVKVGSNFVELENVFGSTVRVHLDEFDRECKQEVDPEGVIRQHLSHHQEAVQGELAEIRKVTERLGLEGQQVRANSVHTSSTMALSTLHSTTDHKKYKRDLIKAKDNVLPKLFEEVEEQHRLMAVWMKAKAIPAKALAEGLKGVVGEIEGRIFNVSLYAGLTEEIEPILEGEPAPILEKVHLFQRLAYMDEEALLNYRHGGMDFSHLDQFDLWLSQKENLERILPCQRSVVAFRVRREKKEREEDGSVATAFVNFQMGELDKLTFLYIRNGRQLWRLNCDQDFGPLIFPGKTELDLSEPMMAEESCGEFGDLMPTREWEDRMKKFEEDRLKYEAWSKQHPKEDRYKNPHCSWDDSDAGSYRKLKDYEPFTKDSVYYDEMTEAVEKRVKYYNRIALILQGLFDRSMALHPHPPARLWDPAGMAELVELVYDGSNTLYHGQAPDFEAYRKSCNASLGAGSITIGQEDVWECREAERENERRRNSWRYKENDCYLHHFTPYGNPGPGYFAKVGDWKNSARKAVYTWPRERQVSTWRHRRGELIECHIAVPAEKLFNVSAYTIGDFKQFFADPRTRARYLQWAHLLLSAEEFHVGNYKIDQEHFRAQKMPRMKKLKRKKGKK